MTKHSAYELANLASTSPNTSESPGSVWLQQVADAVADDVAERLQWCKDNSEELDYSHTAHEIADSAVPIYTSDVWEIFVDLKAYREDITVYGLMTDMEQGAKVALLQIAERLVTALVEEATAEQVTA